MRIRLAEAEVKGISPLSFGRAFQSSKKDGERDDEFDERCWRERMHVARDGIVTIPAMMVKLAIDSAAQRMSMKIPGKGNNTYTKHFTGGILVADDPRLEGVRADKVPGLRLYVNADGKRGGGTRVWRRFPMIDQWETTLRVHVMDDVVSEPIFLKALVHAGMFIGFGRFAPRNRGVNGRFTVGGVKWSTLSEIDSVAEAEEDVEAGASV